MSYGAVSRTDNNKNKKQNKSNSGCVKELKYATRNE